MPGAPALGKMWGCLYIQYLSMYRSPLCVALVQQQHTKIIESVLRDKHFLFITDNFQILNRNSQLCQHRVTGVSFFLGRRQNRIKNMRLILLPSLSLLSSYWNGTISTTHFLGLQSTPEKHPPPHNAEFKGKTWIQSFPFWPWTDWSRPMGNA